MLHQFCFILISGSQVGFALFSSIEITVQRPICQNRVFRAGVEHQRRDNPGANWADCTLHCSAQSRWAGQ